MGSLKLYERCGRPYKYSVGNSNVIETEDLKSMFSLPTVGVEYLSDEKLLKLSVVLS